MSFPFALVIFDLDGVLVASDACHARAYAETWERLGVRGAPPYPQLAGRRTRDVVAEQLARAGVGGDLEASVRFKQERARHHLATAPVVFADTPAAIARFAKAARLAVGTGASRETAELLLARTGARAAFETVVAAEDVTRGKPAPDVYATVLARCAVAPERALVVEDSAAGVAAALAAGAHVAVVRAKDESGGAEPIGSHPIGSRPRLIGAYADLAALADALGLAP
jgi:HAD superfamily hydrolase (TIGR01509 family)